MQLLNLIRKNNYLSVYILIIISANIYLQFIPLTRYFSFEFSFINAILLTFLSGIYFILVYKKLNGGSKRLLLKIFSLAYIFFLLSPALISIIHSFFTSNCPITQGASFYLIITLPSVIVGASLGIISANIYKHFQLLIFLFLFLIILSIPLFEFYLNPQIYFYNPIFAFFPGTIYDENVSLNSHLIIYRIINLIYFGTIFFIFFKNNIISTKLRRITFLTFLVLISAAFIYYSSEFDFATSFSKLNSELNNKVETKHFIIHFPPQIDDNLKKSLCLTHEYYYSELEKKFGVKQKLKINSYIFDSNDEKKKLIGTANADISKPWLECSFITLNDYKETLQHELAHCISSKFGVGILKVAHKLNPALIEGIAVSSSPFYDEHSIYYMAGLAYKNGFKINLQNLFNGYSFYTNASSLSYVYAGSFSKYLIDNYGISKYKKYYSSNNFYASYNLPFLNVQNKFYDFLDSLDISQSRNEAYYYYGYKSIFYKYCPRYIAEQIKKGWQLYNNKKYSSAERYFTYIDNQTNNYSSLIGLADCYLKENNSNEAIKLLKSKISKFTDTGYFYNVEMKLADIYAISGLSNEADSIYEKIIQENPNYYLISAAKIRLTLNNDPIKLKLYLNGSNFDRFLILKDMNEKEYNYYSIPVILELASNLNINFNIIKKMFSRFLDTKTFPEVYSLYKISEYLFEHLEFNSALQLADVVVKNNHNWDYDSIFNENYNKINWSFSNYQDIFNNIKSNNPF